MPTLLEQRVDKIVQDLNAIKKEMILKKTRQASKKNGTIDSWKSLRSRISKKWDHVSATDEINLQRNKL